MEKNIYGYAIVACFLAMLVWGFRVSEDVRQQTTQLETTITSLQSIDGKIQTQNDLMSGKAFYMPGTACIIRTTAEQTPEDIHSYANACMISHREWLTEQEIAREIAEMESESR